MNGIGKLARMGRHWVWVVPAIIGIAFVGAGAYMVLEGRAAHDDVRDNIIREDITVSEDAPAYAGEQVDSAGEADAQADAILQHTLAATGGYLYAEMGRFFLPEGNYMLPNGTYLTEDGGTTQDAAQAAKDDNGAPINVTTDESQAAKNASEQPIRAWTSDSKQAATDANDKPVENALRTTAQTSAFLRTSLGVAVMGFRISDLVVGLGAFLIFMGLLNVIVMSPVTYWATVVADEHQKRGGGSASA